MATDDNGPTTLRNKAQMFLDVYYHVNGEQGDWVCSVEKDKDTDVTLPLGTHLQFVGQDPDQEFDIVSCPSSSISLTQMQYPTFLASTNRTIETVHHRH